MVSVSEPVARVQRYRLPGKAFNVKEKWVPPLVEFRMEISDSCWSRMV